MNLYEKFKDKTIFITVTNESTVYKGTILSQENDWIKFQTELYTFYFNSNHIVRIHIAK